MTLTVHDTDTDTASDPNGRIIVGDPPSTTTTEVIRRSASAARAGLLAAMGVVVAGAGLVGYAGSDRTAGVDPAVTVDPTGTDDHDHTAADHEHKDDPTTYEGRSAAVDPPLPGSKPISTFDPDVSVANYDASVVATVDDGALIVTESGDGSLAPVDQHWVDLPPGFELRALSTSGHKAALVLHDLDGAGRVVGSDILITERPPSWPADPATVTIHHLTGLVEPEAFATDGGSLFVIDHQAASEPGAYRVRPLNLETGELEDMLGPSKQPLIEDMNGVGRRQVWGLGDGRLYTLYIRQTDHVHASGRAGTDGFVHILDLNEEWAFCLDLPSTFGKGDLTTTALAVGSRTVAVLDLSAGEGGQLAYASTEDRTVTEVVDLPVSFRRAMKAMLVAASEEPGRPPRSESTVHLAMHGTALAVGVGESLLWFDGATLEPLVENPDAAYDERVELNGSLIGLTALPGSGVLAWTEGGQSPVQLAPPRALP